MIAPPTAEPVRVAQTFEQLHAISTSASPSGTTGEWTRSPKRTSLATEPPR